MEELEEENIHNNISVFFLLWTPIFLSKNLICIKFYKTERNVFLSKWPRNDIILQTYEDVWINIFGKVAAPRRVSVVPFSRSEVILIKDSLCLIHNGVLQFFLLMYTIIPLVTLAII